ADRVNSLEAYQTRKALRRQLNGGRTGYGTATDRCQFLPNSGTNCSSNSAEPRADGLIGASPVARRARRRRLDGLARSTRDLLNTLAAVTAKKAGFNINQPLSRENSDGRAT